MRTLGIETSGDIASVALVEAGHVLAERVFPARMSLCQTVSGHIQAVLEAETVSAEVVDSLAVSLGPGSFTGLRMGVATAKALAHATGLPLVGVPTPEALAWPLSPTADGVICVLQHARRTDAYVTTYRAAEPFGLEEIAPTTVTDLATALEGLRGMGAELLLVGDGVERHASVIGEALGGLACLAPPALCVPRASVIAALAQARAEPPDPEAAMRLRPRYALPSQAERAQGVDLGL